MSSLKALKPIDTLESDAARLFTHVHPILLLSLYGLNFGSIVADPVPALLNLLFQIGAVQVAYVAICLPPVEGGTASLKGAKAPGKKGTKTAKDAPVVSITSRIFPAVLSLVASSAIATPVFTIILILLGAPLTSHILHTVLCGAHMSLLSVLPLFYTHGVDAGSWRTIVSLAKPVDEVFGAAVGCVLGSWFGAVPVPLDWDREWQKWPVTIVTGAYIGYTVGKLAGRYLFKGKTIQFN